jgi:hypothetical protein
MQVSRLYMTVTGWVAKSKVANRWRCYLPGAIQSERLFHTGERRAQIEYIANLFSVKELHQVLFFCVLMLSL